MLACGAMIPSAALYHTMRLARGDYPWFADTIGIPIFGTVVVAVVLVLLLELLFADPVARGTYPAKLFARFPTTTPSVVALEAPYAVLGAFLCVIALRAFVRGDATGLPIDLVFMYLLLSVRAGLIESKKGEQGAVSPRGNQLDH